ncbi:MAG: MBL fold metallo-hydrolase [Planctomycetaceae bacterium]
MEANVSATGPQMILLGTGTSNGVPMIGCHCDVCRSTNPRNHRTRTGVLVRAPDGNFLIDTPPELRLQLVREQVDLVHAVLFTHGHADHVFGIDDLRLFGYYLQRPVPLFAEPETAARIRTSFDYCFAEPTVNDHLGARPQLEMHELGLKAFDLLGLTVRPIRLWHGRLAVLGFRINNVAFCTDVSRIPDESWPLLENLDTLVLDALRDKPHPTHFGIGQALEVVERVRPARTYLTHISHQLEYAQTNARLPAGVELAYDGLRIDL